VLGQVYWDELVQATDAWLGATPQCRPVVSGHCRRGGLRVGERGRAASKGESFGQWPYMDSLCPVGEAELSLQW
jgi:hypothetical protein